MHHSIPDAFDVLSNERADLIRVLKTYLGITDH